MRALLALLLVALAAPALPTHAAGCVAGAPCVLAVEGRVTDVYGRPIDVCVEAYASDMRSVVGSTPGGETDFLAGAVTRTDADGRYRLELAPGPYSLFTRPSVLGCDVWTSSQYDHGEWRDILVPTTAPQDFTLDYVAYGGTLYGGARPGASLDLWARVGRDVAEQATVTWTDVTSGETVTLALETGDAGWTTRGFGGAWSVPAERPDGVYRGRLVATDAEGRVFGNVTERYVVDGVAPVIVSTYPADGNTSVPASFRPRVNASDALGVRSGHVVVYHVTEGGRVFADETHFWRNGSGGLTPLRALSLEAGRAYEAEFRVHDHGGNVAARTVAFST